MKVDHYIVILYAFYLEHWGRVYRLFCLYFCVETSLWEGGFQQGHVQQVDPSGQGPRGRSQDLQDCEFIFTSDLVCFVIECECCFYNGENKYDTHKHQFHACVCVCARAQVEHLEDLVRDKLLLVQKGQASQLEEKEKNELKKRKLLSEV